MKTKKEVIKALENAEYPSGIANVICNVSFEGRVFNNVSILVLLWGYGEDDSACDDDQIKIADHWYICEGIKGFKDYLNQTKAIDFIEVREFVTDFNN